MARLTKVQRKALQVLRENGGKIVVELYGPKEDEHDWLIWSFQELRDQGIVGWEPVDSFHWAYWLLDDSTDDPSSPDETEIQAEQA